MDLNNPFEVIARTNRPVLEPREPYERIGDVNNVVFPTAYVYYGGADKVCCLAVVELDPFLEFIIEGCENN